MDQAIVERAKAGGARSPSRSATPVPKLSMATSADFASACTSRRPLSDFILIAMLALVAVGAQEHRAQTWRRKRRPSARLITLPHRLDLDDLGTEITEILRAERPGQHLREIENPGYHRAVLTRSSLLPVRFDSQTDGKQAAEIGGKTFPARDQQIVGRAPFAPHPVLTASARRQRRPPRGDARSNSLPQSSAPRQTNRRHPRSGHRSGLLPVDTESRPCERLRKARVAALRLYPQRVETAATASRLGIQSLLLRAARSRACRETASGSRCAASRRWISSRRYCISVRIARVEVVAAIPARRNRGMASGAG